MEGTVPDLVEALLACADNTRLRILHVLLDGRELCVYDLVEVTGASQPKISRHLAYLRRSGLVSCRKDGLWVYYRLATDTAPPITALLDSLGPIFARVPELERDLIALDSLQAGKVVVERRYTALEHRTPSAPRAPSYQEPQQAVISTQTAYDHEKEDLEVELL